MSFDVHQLDPFVLVGSVVTLLAILAVRVSSRAGLPSLLIYLLMGVALGEAGVGIGFENAELAHSLGFAALAMILAEGGLTTSWREARPSMRLGALAGHGRRRGLGRGRWRSRAHYLLGLPWELAVLLGAVTSPTDAAAVFSVLRVVPLPRRLTGAARGGVRPQRRPDRGAGDPDLDRRGRRQRRPRHRRASWSSSWSSGVLRRAWPCGFGGAWVMRRAALPSSGLYPLAVLTLRLPRLRQRRRACTPPASRRCTSRRWCSATPTCRTAAPPGPSPRASPGWPRSGCS